MTLRRSAALLICLFATGSLAACGDDPQKINRGDTEAAYLNIAGLKYQVQLSRQLNDHNVEDMEYLQGLSPANRRIDESKQVWFAVFMRVENAGTKPHPTALPQNFTIADTQGTQYSPVPSTGLEAYRPETLGPKSLLPDPQSVPAFAPTQGEVLLYKVNYTSLDDRPLELTIKSPMAPQKIGVVDLDV